MTSVKIRINVSRRNKEGQYPLIIQVIHQRCKREVYMPYRVYKEELNVETEQLHAGRRGQERRIYLDEAYRYTVRVKELILAICRKLEISKKNFTVEDIWVSYKHHDDYNNLFVFAGHLSKKLLEEGKDGTSSNYRNAVQAFSAFINDQSFTFDRITPQLIEKYQLYLHRKGNKPNTVWHYVYQLRAIYRKAVSMNIIHPDPDPFASVEMKKEKTPKRAISSDMLWRIADVDLSDQDKSVQLARDLFMFSFYSRGMSFVDMCYLRKENLVGDILFYRRKKTGQLLEMKVESELMDLIEKYADPSSPYLLPVLREDDSYMAYRLAQRRLNKRILLLGKLLKYPFPLTFYAARHTWATKAQEEGISLAVISSCMGHISQETTRIYLAQISRGILDDANKRVVKGRKRKK